CYSISDGWGSELISGVTNCRWSDNDSAILGERPVKRQDRSMKLLKRLSPFLAFLLLAPLGQLRAQVGGDNPTGPFGIFNGNVTTGCSYDPYTGNAMRSIPDISVAGAVGSYGLALSRT